MSAAPLQAPTRSAPRIQAHKLVYGAALLAAIANWFVAIRAPLWFDEGISYAQISGGLSQIYARAGGSFPGYSYFLWTYTQLFGTAEIVLRIPSIVAMLAATYVLYRCARELFFREAALVTTTVFALHPIVVFASIDVRQYAFAILAVNIACWRLLIWCRTESLRNAMLFGASSALIFYFHTLFGIVLLPLTMYLLLEKRHRWKLVASQLAAAVATFAVLMVPIVPRLLHVSNNRVQHVFAAEPVFNDVLFTIGPDHLFLVLFGVLLLAVAAIRSFSVFDLGPGATRLPLLLGVLPLASFYTVSVLTPLHIFVSRYLLVCVPGIALCWGLVVSRIRWQLAMSAFCALAVATAMIGVNSPRRATHGYTWKHALQAAETNTARDHAPLLICNDIPESNFAPLPATATNDGMWAPIGYYKVSSPVVPLPRAWNVDAALQVRRFLASAAPNKQRFLVLAFEASWPNIDWIKGMTKKDYVSREIGNYEGVRVVEFRPKD
jgi:mannosyltransferase